MGLLLSFLGGGGLVLLLSGKGREKKHEGWEQRMAHLEEAVNRAGFLNSDFFHSLEISQKCLKSLLTQADWAEQNLRRLLSQTEVRGEQVGGKVDQYATAALLLSEGEEAKQVARALKLPLAQVRLVQELRQEMAKEKAADWQEKAADLESTAAQAALVKGLVTRHVASIRNGTTFAAGRES
jgi:hypothetical protein